MRTRTANYLQANFDFGTTFRSIDSVSLELTMPSGFGAGFSTGNSSVFSQLLIYLRRHYSILDPRVLRPSRRIRPHVCMFPSPPLSIARSPLNNFPIRGEWVARTEQQEINRVWSPAQRLLRSVDVRLQPAQILDYYWPPFVISGKGRSNTSRLQRLFDFHPLSPDGDTTGFYSSTSYGKPPAVTQATLVVVATAGARSDARSI